MNSDWYKALFPTRLAPQKQSVQEFQTTQSGFRLATSVGGVLTGRGADIIIIDDPLKPDEAVSDDENREGKIAVEKALKALPVGSSVTEMERVKNPVLKPFEDAIKNRRKQEEQQERTRRWLDQSLNYVQGYLRTLEAADELTFDEAA